MAIGKRESIVSKSNQIALPVGVRAEVELERAEKHNVQMQDMVNQYNDQILKGAIEDIEKFKTRKYFNNVIVVKLLKDDWIEKSATNGILFTQIKKSNKIPIETPQMGKETKMIDNPLPYRFEGIIVAMDETIPTKDEQYKDLKVGSLIRTISFDLKEDRYYFNDHERDHVSFEDIQNLSTNLFPNYEGYAIIHPGMIQNMFVNAEELRT